MIQDCRETQTKCEDGCNDEVTWASINADHSPSSTWCRLHTRHSSNVHTAVCTRQNVQTEFRTSVKV